MPHLQPVRTIEWRTYGVLDYAVGGADVFESLGGGACGHVAVESECGPWYIVRENILMTYSSEILENIFGQREDSTRGLTRLVEMMRKEMTRIDCYGWLCSYL